MTSTTLLLSRERMAASLAEDESAWMPHEIGEQRGFLVSPRDVMPPRLRIEGREPRRQLLGTRAGLAMLKFVTATSPPGSILPRRCIHGETA
jgi:hypothetical protein